MNFNIFLVICLIFVLFLIDINANLENQCGKNVQIKGTVFGGSEILQNQFPWLVALFDSTNKKFFCGGTLVSNKHVVSGEIQK